MRWPVLFSLPLLFACAPSASDAVPETAESALQVCSNRQLTFSADELLAVPAAEHMVWGGNANGGEDVLYSDDFKASAEVAHLNDVLVFAYLEGPCGDTDGVDDGERSRCESLHRQFNQTHAPGTVDSPLERWKPFTMRQLTDSGAAGVDFCEIDNLSNNVTVPLIPLLHEIKALYDAGDVGCRLVLKNVAADELDEIKRDVATTPADAEFIAPFAIFEADDLASKADLDAAMRRLKGVGAKTIISTDTNAYGSAFTSDTFRACE